MKKESPAEITFITFYTVIFLLRAGRSTGETTVNHPPRIYLSGT